MATFEAQFNPEFLENIFVSYCSSPVGLIRIKSTENAVTEVFFVEKETPAPSAQLPEVAAQCAQQLQEYFGGQRKEFDLPLLPMGTGFQQRVWNELQKIPYGQSATYLDMARRLGDEKTIRAAASANGKNPIAIIIPCHRVIGSDGKLVGYAGGMHRKRWLLQHEGIIGRELF